MNTKLSGAMGEALIADYYRKKHYKIAAMNYRTAFGEIDLIVSNRKKLIFVEVKLRSEGALLRAADAVGRAKQGRLRSSAELWLSSNPDYSKKEISFSVAEVYLTSAGELDRINIIDNAF